MRMGRTSSYDSTGHWLRHWRAHLSYFHTELYNVYGEAIQWHFSVNVGKTSVDLMRILQRDVEQEGQGIKGYSKRVIIMGSLNDIIVGLRNQREVLTPGERAAATHVRDYISQFHFGQVTWVGPGDETAWSYNIPLKSN